MFEDILNRNRSETVLFESRERQIWKKKSTEEMQQKYLGKTSLLLAQTNTLNVNRNNIYLYI